ncbi:hypothetical protein ACTMTI_40085 [Nonomuraea sp. H19]|uniref:hypothetical protein n=1 Tax=Nonomuraea sp. H19 TaxID=3452206 RepID=UPI003F8B7A32
MDKTRGMLVAVQIALAWSAGSIIATTALCVGVVAFFSGALSIVALVAALVVLGAVGLLFLVATASREASPLTSTRGRRLGWALLVFAGGMGAWWSGAVLNSTLRLPLGSDPLLMVVASGAGFGLCAAILAGRWFTLGALMISIGLVAGGVHLTSREQARQQEQAWQEVAAPEQELAYTTSIAGYHMHHDGMTAFFTPQNPGVERVWQDHAIALNTERGEYSTKACGEPEVVVMFGRSEHVECTVERPGLWYRSGRIPEPKWGCPCGIHEYVMQRGARFVRIGSSDAIPKETLRDAIVQARPLTEAELRKTIPTSMRRGG